MTATQIKAQIEIQKTHLAINKSRMDQEEIEWVNANIADLQSRIPQGRYEEKVAKFGWKSVERNA